MDFPYSRPFGDEFYEQMRELAEDIATEKGLVYKLWTENKEIKEAGGIYVFDNLYDANKYLDKHTKRLVSFGIIDIRAKTFIINEELSAICKSIFSIQHKKSQVLIINEQLLQSFTYFFIIYRMRLRYS